MVRSEPAERIGDGRAVTLVSSARPRGRWPHPDVESRTGEVAGTGPV